jgi:hypothetical protein
MCKSRSAFTSMQSDLDLHWSLKICQLISEQEVSNGNAEKLAWNINKLTGFYIHTCIEMDGFVCKAPLNVCISIKRVLNVE